ncbi:uncharacterized protein LOC128556237 isoform X2 [Mercenaria mercenaria]|uniref:uncharacterized protein LOC128556237 isoform X2 n=1 Tax=Mercenaria mercenaria TaxID=6596 RepID=UPI00234EBD70|nr:uncharacterized protein LOC128556237 isoform X2 [Mercenaria mercenaria]
MAFGARRRQGSVYAGRLEYERRQFQRLVNSYQCVEKMHRGCLSEEPHSSFSHKYVRMLSYLSHHRSFVGRQWLFESLEERLQDNSTKQGVILMADMGYGKTAVVAKIVCATPSDDSYNLRKRLIAYHICRFDSIITKRQFVFIRRLTSMIAQSIPMFSELLKYQYTSCTDNFDAETCEKDPYGCFDECLINPLRSLPAQSGKPKLIIIDALDECEQHEDDRINGINGIASLLKYKLHLFPKWFKFILTCRTVWYCRQLKSRMDILNLDSGDKRNVNDIKTFISTKGFNNNVYDFNFEPSSFLLVLSILNSDASLGQIQSLNIFYEHQFKRYFDIKYKHAKDILEIICSSFQPIIETQLWNIVSDTTDINPEDFEAAMRHLAHFLKSIDNKVHIMHVSLQEWLLDKENIDFKINLSVGHYLNALYLLKLLREKREKIDVVTLVSHAAYANTNMKVNVLDNFYSLKTKDVIKMDNNKNDYPLHRLARKSDSAVAAKCLLKHFPEIDRLDKYNVTPAFLAASFGNLEILKTLTKAGANITFRTKSFEYVIHLNLAAQMSFEKFHWGYGILDIAAQNGQYNIVKFILKDYKRFNYPIETKNGMNLLPVHLACKLGHIKIVKYIYECSQWLDNVCLYYAAEGGHTGLVEYLLKIKIKDDCKLCGPNLHWIPKGMIRIQGQMIVSNFQRRYQNIYILSDDWHFIACETALHVAVRKGYVEVVKALLHFPTIYSFKCADRGGRTPLISAIQYNHTDIVNIFISKNLFRSGVKCVRPPSLSDIPQLHEKERTILKSYSCPNASSVMHIIAKCNSVWVVDQLQMQNITPKWDIRDSEGCFPVHTAACHGSMEVLKHLLDIPKNRSKDYKCTDGTSLLETAAKCSSYASVSFLVGGTVNIDSYYLKKSVVFVALNRSKGISFAVNNLDTESNISKIIQIFLKNQDDIMKKYERNRNILHISLLHGHHQVASDIFLKYSKAAIQLMRDKDLDTYTPLRLAVSNLEKTTSFLFNFSSNTTMETSKCFLTNRDYTILISLDFIEKKSLLSENGRKLLLLELIQKNTFRWSLCILDLSTKTYFEMINLLNKFLGSTLLTF